MGTSVTARKEVSCLALTFFYDYLEERGISRRRLQEGLPYTPEFLDNRINWIDYATFLAIERRMAELVPQDDLFYDIGLTFAATRGFGFMRVIFRSVASPQQVYAQLPRLVHRFLFPFVTIEIDRIDPSRLRGTYTFDEGFPPSAAFLDTVRGLLTGVPATMGLPPATVNMTLTRANQAVYDIELEEGDQSLLGSLGGVRRRIVETGRMWMRNLRDAAGELEETNRLLQEQVDALTDAKKQLDGRVRDLTILNTVSREATHGGFSIQSLLQNIVAVLSRQLGQVPAAVFLAEGEPRTLVLAASANFPRDFEDAVEHERIDQTLENPRPLAFSVGTRSVRVLPMTTPRTTVAVLVVGDVDASEEPLLGSVASQLAVIVENALSFQTIADLRDNLDLRVRERTAELEEAHGQLEDTIERLKRSDRARTEFFTNVSHELRTPLTLILAPLDEVDRALASAPAPVRANLKTMRDSAHALLRLINEILDFARIDAERMPVRPQTVCIDDLIEDLVTSLRPLAARRRVTIEWARPPEPVTAEVDTKLFRRALMNLIGNGIKYVHEGQRVTVRLREAGERFEVAVADEGLGIAPEHHAKVFERFQRVPDADGRVIEGSGIGLAMVKEIVMLHRGTVSLDSAPGKGATFTVQLPRTGLPERGAETPESLLPDELTSSLEPTAPAVTEAAPVAPSRSGVAESRLLVVEDNREMREFLVRLLSPHHRILQAVDGAEALTIVRDEMPDGILSDVMMPRVDGLELCRQLKADRVTRHIPVILISARHAADAAIDGFAAGADDYVVKPFSAPELLSRIDAQLRVRRLGLTVMRMEKQTTLGLLAAGIAHEVRNPVNAVLNAVPPLRSAMARLGNGGETGSLAEALLDSIDRSGQRIRLVVDAMLALSRREPDQLKLRPMHLGEVIDNTLAILQYRISDGVTVHREFEWDDSFWAYPDLVSQVVMNLIVNALDAVDPRRGNIWIHVGRDGDSVCLRIADDGSGVPSDLRERIFEAFFTTKAPGTGTGLGLAISREIASLHAGSLEFSADSAPGAAFILTLPIGDAPRATPSLPVALGAQP